MLKNRLSTAFGPNATFWLSIAGVFAAVALVGQVGGAFGGCNSPNPGCWQAEPPPCANIVNCYPAPAAWGLVCTDGTPIKYYRNTKPPGGWSNCTAVQGSGYNYGPCTEQLVQCGTTFYFTNDCTAGDLCLLGGGKTGSVRSCEAMTGPACLQQ